MQVWSAACSMKKMEGLDCVSLGPDMKDIHTSVRSFLSIASAERVWKYLVKALEASERLKIRES